jgi:hypothetical protein
VVDILKYRLPDPFEVLISGVLEMGVDKYVEEMEPLLTSDTASAPWEEFLEIG